MSGLADEELDEPAVNVDNPDDDDDDELLEDDDDPGNSLQCRDLNLDGSSTSENPLSLNTFISLP